MANKETKKQREARHNRLCAQALSYVEVNIFDLSKVSARMREELASGVEEQTAVERVRAFALTLPGATESNSK